MSSPETTPSGDRFSPISQDDHAGYLWIAALLAGIYSVLAIFLRTYIKRDCFGIDDWICAAATVRGRPVQKRPCRSISMTKAFLANA
jgi:hypothetical protein